MLLVNGLGFDNTLSVKRFASSNEAQKLLDIPRGFELQIHKIDDIVSVPMYGLDDARIADIYMENGYCRYVVEWKRLKKNCKTKYDTFSCTVRLKDIA